MKFTEPRKRRKNPLKLEIKTWNNVCSSLFEVSLKMAILTFLLIFSVVQSHALENIARVVGGHVADQSKLLLDTIIQDVLSVFSCCIQGQWRFLVAMSFHK